MTNSAIAFEARRVQLRQWMALLLLYGFVGLMLVLTWGRMSDVIIDFGRELYIPWQLSEGRVLYQDVAYFNGPVSPYFNALMFKCFGVSMATLNVVNGVILCLIVTLVFKQLSRFFSVGLSLFTCVAFLVIQGFGYTAGFGNYNYISPYSHEMTHGIALSMLVLWLLHRNHQPCLFDLMATGIAWGLTWLTKPEFFVAITGAIVVSVTIPFIKPIDTARQLLRNSICILSGAVVPLFLFWALLAAQGGTTIAGQGILGSWHWIFNSDVAQLAYYQERAGTDQLLLNALLLIRDVFAASVLGFAAWLVTGQGDRRKLLIASVCLVGVLLLTGRLLPAVLNGRVVAVVIILLSLHCAWRLIHSGEFEFRKQLHLFSWCTLATLLLLKIMLNVELFEYGFALTMPALVLMIPAAIHWLPEWVAQTTRHQSRFRTAIVAVVAIEVLAFFVASTAGLAGKDQLIDNRKYDHLLTHAETVGTVYQQAIRYLEEHCQTEDTVLALPEGVMINYLLRRENPTPFVNFMPPELEMFDESRMVQQMSQQPGDYVLLVNRRVGVYGKDHFGEPGFGDQIMNWVHNNYARVQTFGADHLDNNRFGITILRRAPEKMATANR